ncbi:MAG: hypothetical protein H7A37_07730 [Chlamydiales bacterium]|nr:hypothetical protein [Chlamydiales bacterium]
MKWFLDLGAPLRYDIWEELPRLETPSSVYIFLVDYGIQITQENLRKSINNRYKVPEDAIIYILEKHPNLVSEETLNNNAANKNLIKVVDFLFKE